MHLYKKKGRIPSDRPHGVNVPGGNRRLIKVVSGDTLMFTANVVCPATREPVSAADLEYTSVYVAVAENRFSPVIWSGSIVDGWIRLDENKKGLVHVTVPRTVMNVLRRGSYAFSIVVDDGIVRETQMAGNFQVEYEPTGSVTDIPYRSDESSGDPISLTPEVDLAAQRHHRLTYDQLVKAVDDIAMALVRDGNVVDALFGYCETDPTYEEVEHAVHRLSQMIIWDKNLRDKIPLFCRDRHDSTYDEVVERVCSLLRRSGMDWSASSSCADKDPQVRRNPRVDGIILAIDKLLKKARDDRSDGAYESTGSGSAGG